MYSAVPTEWANKKPVVTVIPIIVRKKTIELGDQRMNRDIQNAALRSSRIFRMSKKCEESFCYSGSRERPLVKSGVKNLQ